jgi:hypothetical protein
MLRNVGTFVCSCVLRQNAEQIGPVLRKVMLCFLVFYGTMLISAGTVVCSCVLHNAAQC